MEDRLWRERNKGAEPPKREGAAEKSAATAKVCSNVECHNGCE